MKVAGGQIIPLDGKTKYRCQHWKLRVATGLNPRTGKYSTRNKNFHGSYKEVLEAHAEFRREVTKEKRPDRVDLTFEELCDRFIDYKIALGKITKSTAQKQQAHLNLFIRHLGKAKAKNIQPYMIIDAIKELKEGDTPSGKSLSGTYLNKSVSLCRGVYNFGIQEQFVAENPFEKVDAPSIDTKEKEALTEEQLITLLNLDKTKRCNVLIFVAIFTGLRRGELSALRWKHVDFQNGFISVKESMEANGNIKETKTKASTDFVPMAGELEKVLTNWKATQQQAMIELGIYQTDEMFVFANRFGDQWKPGQITKWWDRYRKKVGCSNISFHQLRHTFITYLAMCNVHPKVMQSLARHASEDMTLGVYTHVNKEQEKAAINTLNLKLCEKIRT